MGTAVRIASIQREGELSASRAGVESGLPAFYSKLDLGDSDHYSPGFFLASVSRRAWSPALVLISDGTGEPAGILYSKERKIGAFKTGLIFADATLGALIAARDDDQQEAFRAGMKKMLASREVRGVRLLAPTGGYEAGTLEQLAKETGFEFRTAPAESHSILPLPDTNEEFLARLSSKTRRNFRYYRNRSENAGHAFVERLELDEFTRAAWILEGEGTTGGDAEGLERALKMFAAAKEPLLVGLRSADGELLSVVGGWYEENRAVIFMQLNSDKKHAKYSLSLVMRAHLIERLIEQEYGAILWWAGVGEPLNHYSTPVPSMWLYADRPSLSWRSARCLVDLVKGKLPPRYRAIADWVTPPQI